jgi:hypothetical protein
MEQMISENFQKRILAELKRLNEEVKQEMEICGFEKVTIKLEFNKGDELLSDYEVEVLKSGSFGGAFN